MKGIVSGGGVSLNLAKAKNGQDLHSMTDIGKKAEHSPDGFGRNEVSLL